MKIDAQRLSAAPHIANAHGTGVSVAPNLAEGLHLHGAHKGHNGIGEGVDALRQKADSEKQDDFRQHNELPPMHLFHVFEMPVNALRRKNAQQEGQHRDEIPNAVFPFAIEQVCAEQDNIAGLCVGKYLAPAKIRIGVLQTAGENNKGRRQERF